MTCPQKVPYAGYVCSAGTERYEQAVYLKSFSGINALGSPLSLPLSRIHIYVATTCSVIGS